MKQRHETSRRSTGFVSIVYSFGSICLLRPCLGNEGAVFALSWGMRWFMLKRSRTSGLINHFFSSLGFRGILFSFHYILSLFLSLSLFLFHSLSPPICAACHLLTFWQASSPISLLPPHLLPNLFRWKMEGREGCEWKWLKCGRRKERKERACEESKKKELWSCKSSLMKSVCVSFNSQGVPHNSLSSEWM